MIMAGSGVTCGQVVGLQMRSALIRKTALSRQMEVVATMLHALDIDWGIELPGGQGRPVRVIEQEVKPIYELF
jgi:hypothetical protein